MYYVYVIQNKNNKIYIGQTEDLDERLKRHNRELKSKRRSYTTINRGPWKLIYNEMVGSRKEAMLREKYLKSHFGRDWIRNNIMGR